MGEVLGHDGCAVRSGVGEFVHRKPPGGAGMMPGQWVTLALRARAGQSGDEDSLSAGAGALLWLVYSDYT